jgi:hypothetical protein
VIRSISLSEAQVLLDRIEENGAPADIIELKRKLDAAIRNAEQLAILFGTIDMVSVGEVVALKLSLDGLYVQHAGGGRTLH